MTICEPTSIPTGRDDPIPSLETWRRWQTAQNAVKGLLGLFDGEGIVGGIIGATLGSVCALPAEIGAPRACVSRSQLGGLMRAASFTLAYAFSTSPLAGAIVHSAPKNVKLDFFL